MADPSALQPSSAILFLLFTTSYLTRTVEGILCYQCNSTDVDEPYQCEEFMGEHGSKTLDIVPRSCDQVYGAAYCIKHTGRFEADGIVCYQCAEEGDCWTANLTDDGPPPPASCDHVFEARYCVKATTFRSGGIGTRRYCSSIDMGNYCNYIKQPGDIREYRSCVYTCSTDGCNGADRSLAARASIGLSLLVLLHLW